MSRLLFVTIITGWCVVAFTNDACALDNPWHDFKRPAIKEPRYKAIPKYCLLALGVGGDVKVWMVEDGKRLFVDKNANGDLTDDGAPLEPSNFRDLGPNQWDFNYLLNAITPTNGSRHTSFDLRRWKYRQGDEEYGLSLSVDGKLPVYAGWFGTFWSTNRELAPIIHLGGAFTPKLVRLKEFVIGAEAQHFSLGFMCPGSGPGTESRLSIESIPKLFVPTVNIEWPTASDHAPLRTTERLTERCCYWEFYTKSLRTPEGAVPGKAKLSVNFPTTGTEIVLASTEFEVPVVEKAKKADSPR